MLFYIRIRELRNSELIYIPDKEALLGVQVWRFRNLQLKKKFKNYAKSERTQNSEEGKSVLKNNTLKEN